MCPQKDIHLRRVIKQKTSLYNHNTNTSFRLRGTSKVKELTVLNLKSKTRHTGGKEIEQYKAIKMYSYKQGASHLTSIGQNKNRGTIVQIEYI